MIDKVDAITPGAGIRLRKKGVVDFNGMYKDMRAWFGGVFFEKEQSVKDKDLGREITIKWEAKREIDAYAQFNIKVNFFIQNVEERREQNKKMQDGNFEIKFWAEVVLDYADKWERKPFGQFLFRLYNNMVIKSKIQNVYEDKLDKELQSLIAIARSYL